MTFLTELRECVDVLSARPELDVEPDQLLAAMRTLGGEEAAQVLADASAVTRCVERMVTVASAVICELSTRDRGQGGFAATKGHRSPVSLVQSIQGGTRADAVRTVRVGESLSEADQAAKPAAGSTGETTDVDTADTTSAPKRPWHHGLGQALLRGSISRDAHHAILRGLGDPPLTDGEGEPSDAAVEVWAIAAEQLMAETRNIDVDELLRRTRTVRDVLDPVGAERRFQQGFEERSFRTRTDERGRHHGHIIFDDEMYAWVRASVDSALRPRRGGPRFVDADDAAAAKTLADDQRTNDQLAYDLLMDILRAGAIADAPSVFGSRQPGVRMTVIKDLVGPRDPFGRLLAVGHLEDGGDALPGPVIDRRLCEHGGVDITVDSCGNPLDVGREQRLFTPQQRLALANRDGGCIWPDCDRPASYCEAHHGEHWENGGTTDVERGLLLCRFHHMNLHHNGWRITRDGKGPFVLHSPPESGGAPIALTSKAAWKWAWDPPPDRASWRSGRGAPREPVSQSPTAA